MQQRTMEAAAVAAGGEDAIARFVRVYRELFPPVYGYVRFRVGDPQAAEDITAQVFERALRRLASVQDPARVRAWLFAIARNAVTDYRRAKRPTSDLETVDDMEHLWAESPEAEALRREERRRLLSHLRTLSEREREVVVLKFAAGLTNRDIASVLGLSEANVAQILHRAVAALRRRFVEEDAQ